MPNARDRCFRPAPERVVDEAGAGQGARRVEGRVTAQLPSGLYQVDVEGARITAHLGSGLDRNFVRVLIGDQVEVELTPRDLTRGRIVRKTR
jgi:translation initiation factor IF-1